eukprot:jgi/Mesvir1/12137/Mv00390-RA.2
MAPKKAPSKSAEPPPPPPAEEPIYQVTLKLSFKAHYEKPPPPPEEEPAVATAAAGKPSGKPGDTKKAAPAAKDAAKDKKGAKGKPVEEGPESIQLVYALPGKEELFYGEPMVLDKPELSLVEEHVVQADETCVRRLVAAHGLFTLRLLRGYGLAGTAQGEAAADAKKKPAGKAERPSSSKDGKKPGAKGASLAEVPAETTPVIKPYGAALQEMEVPEGARSAFELIDTCHFLVRGLSAERRIKEVGERRPPSRPATAGGGKPLGGSGGEGAAAGGAWDDIDDISIKIELDKPLFTDQIGNKLNPLVLTPVSAKSLPDRPAAPEQLDTLCRPITLQYRFPLSPQLFVLEATAVGPWRENECAAPNPAEPIQVRDVRFAAPGSKAVFLASSFPLLELTDTLEHEKIEVRVHDRTPITVAKPSAFSADILAEAQAAVKAAQAAQADGNANAGSVGNGAGEEGDPASSDPTSSSFLSPDMYGYAHVSLAELCRGQRSIKLKANLVPKNAPPKGGFYDVDWHSRPGLYVASGARVTLRADIFAPLVPPPVTERVFQRAVFNVEYRDTQLMTAVYETVRTHNAAVLGMTGEKEHVLRSLQTYRLTEEQLRDKSLDLITGFQLIDKRGLRMFVLEGLAEGGMKRIQQLYDASVGDKTFNRRLLHHKGLRFCERLYGVCGADVLMVKLCDTLNNVVAKRTGPLKPDCDEGLRRLSALSNVIWQREAKRMSLFPSAAMLTSLYRKFGGELTLDDVRGVKEVDPNTNEEVADTPEELSVYEYQRKYARLKAATVCQNEEYLRAKAELEALRATRNHHHENLERLKLLESTMATMRLAHTATVRAYEGGGEAGEGEEPTSPSKEEAKDSGIIHHEKPFQWPAKRDPAEYIAIKNKPTDARITELREPWEENALAKASEIGPHSNPGGGPLFKTIVTPAGGECFNKDPEYFKTVHLSGDGLAKEIEVRAPTHSAASHVNLLCQHAGQHSTALHGKPY